MAIINYLFACLEKINTLCAQGISLSLIVFTGMQSSAQNDLLYKGYVEDALSSERLVGVSIYNDSLHVGAYSNNFGFFSFNCRHNHISLTLSYVGYQSKVISLFADTLDHIIHLEPALWLDTISVTNEKEGNFLQQIHLGAIHVPTNQLQYAPAPFGERDIFKTLQLLPGIQVGNEGESGIHVRGGSSDQNLILIDGVPIYNASHVFGFFSAINSDAVKNVNIYKGGFPAKYAGRLSSIVDVVLKDGDRKKWKGDMALGLLALKMNLEGPLIRDKTTLMFSARRSFLDLLGNNILRKRISTRGNESKLDYFFSDFSLKISHDISTKQRLTFSIIQGLDNYSRLDNYQTAQDEGSVKTGLGWKNLVATLRWTRQWTNNLFGSSRIGLNQYRYKNFDNSVLSTRIGDTTKESQVNFDYTTRIKDFNFNNDFEFTLNENHNLMWGMGMTYHQYEPGNFTTSSRLGIIDSFAYRGVDSWEGSVYLEDAYKVSSTISLNLGMHYATYHTKETFYSQLQPRINFKLLLNDNLAIKSSYSRMAQYTHLLSNDGVGLATDIWLPTNRGILPEKGYIFSSGFGSADNGIDWSVETYYKKLENVVSFKENSTLLLTENIEDKITQGKGEAYGFELFAHKKKGRLNGWVGYTLSWSNRTFKSINAGRTFPYTYDRRHVISLTSNYQISDRLRIAINWIYSSGRAVTLVPYVIGALRSSTYFDWYTANIGNSFNTYPERNNFRFSSYHRLDIDLSYRFGKKYQHEIIIGAYNAYNRKNPYYLSSRLTNQTGSGGQSQGFYELVQYSLFPRLPSFSYHYYFSK